jgi:DNA-binding NtrC family response regulator
MAETVLLVEDEILIRMAAFQHLEDCGYTVLQAANAAEALEILKRYPQIDLVFTDVRMPGEMDGLGLAKWVIEHRPHIAVMIASGHAAKENVLQELCGAHAFTKPYSFDDLTVRIREALQARKPN